MKTVIILLVLGLLVVSGVAYQLFFVESTSEETESESELQVNETVKVEGAAGEVSGVGTLAALRARNTDLECAVTYSSDEYQGPVTGSYFINANKVRGDFIVPAPELGGTVLTSVVIDTETLYVWSDIDGQLFGVKTSLEDKDIFAAEAEVRVPVSESEDVKYTCKPWLNIDESLFEPPTTVLFKDASDLSDSDMEYGTIYEEGEF